MRVYKHTDEYKTTFLFDREDGWSYLCLDQPNRGDRLYAGYKDRDYYDPNPPGQFQQSSWLELLVLAGISKVDIERVYGLDAVELVKQLKPKREGVHG